MDDNPYQAPTADAADFSFCRMLGSSLILLGIFLDVVAVLFVLFSEIALNENPAKAIVIASVFCILAGFILRKWFGGALTLAGIVLGASALQCIRQTP